MARTNFQYEKRQRELDKKRKAEEKARRKQEARQERQPDGAAAAPLAADATAGPALDGGS